MFQHCDDALIRSIVTLLEDPNLEVAMYASCIVANLTAERADVKNSILRVGGIEVLLRVLQICRREDTVGEETILIQGWVKNIIPRLREFFMKVQA